MQYLWCHPDVLELVTVPQMVQNENVARTGMLFCWSPKCQTGAWGFFFIIACCLRTRGSREMFFILLSASSEGRGKSFFNYWARSLGEGGRKVIIPQLSFRGEMGKGEMFYCRVEYIYVYIYVYIYICIYTQIYVYIRIYT